MVTFHLFIFQLACKKCNPALSRPGSATGSSIVRIFPMRNRVLTVPETTSTAGSVKSAFRRAKGATEGSTAQMGATNGRAVSYY